MARFLLRWTVLIPIQTGDGGYWMHEDPVTKSKRVTDNLGNVMSTVKLDPRTVTRTEAVMTRFSLTNSQPASETSHSAIRILKGLSLAALGLELVSHSIKNPAQAGTWPLESQEADCAIRP